MAVVANRVITPIAVIGSRVDLAVNDPVEFPGKRGLSRGDVHAEGSDAEDDPPAATSLARLNVTLKPRKDAFAGNRQRPLSTIDMIIPPVLG